MTGLSNYTAGVTQKNDTPPPPPIQNDHWVISLRRGMTQVIILRREMTPDRRERTPDRKEMTPYRREMTPYGREMTPDRRERTPDRRERTPSSCSGMTPS